MYEQFLRDPASVGGEWRALFENGHQDELPIIPATRDEVLATPGSGELGVVPPAAPQGTTPHTPPPAGLTPITGPAASLVQNMPDSLAVPTATSFRDVAV